MILKIEKKTLEAVREERLNQIRQVGQSIIDNAESILGDEKYRTDLVIKATFHPHEVPEIIVQRHFIPEHVVEGLCDTDV